MISGFNVTTFHDGDMSFSQHPNEEFANPLSHLPEAMQGGSPLSIAFIKYFLFILTYFRGTNDKNGTRGGLKDNSKG